MTRCMTRTQQWAGAALLLLVLPMVRGSTGAELDLEELMWPQGNSVDDTSLLFLPQQMAAMELAKRTGLVSDMQGGMGSMGGFNGGRGGGPVLSFDVPMHLIHQNLYKQKMQGQAQANRERFEKVGKRSVPSSTHAQQQQAYLRGLLLRRHERSARLDEHSSSSH